MVNRPGNESHGPSSFVDCSRECVIRGSKSEWRWVVNPTILLRRDRVVNQVMNRRLMLKRMQMHPGIQEPRERTEWWRDNPYLRIVPADIDHSKFYSQIVPVNEVQRRKEEGGKENVLVSSGHCLGTATKGIAHWYYHVRLLLSLSPLYVHWNHPCTVASSEILLGQSVISPNISWPPLPPSVISLVRWNHPWTSRYFSYCWDSPSEFLDTPSVRFSVSLYSVDGREMISKYSVWLEIGF